MSGIKKQLSIDSKLTIVVFLLAFLQYVNTLNFQYTWDDSLVITENARVQKGMPGIPYLFLKYNSQFKTDKYGYRPVVLTSFAIDYQLFGLYPKASHLINVLYFSLLCVVLFNVLKRIFFQFSVLPSFLIVVLFIAHPLHSEVVANVKSRDEIFSLLFSLLSLSHLIRYSESKKIKNVIYSFMLFALAFLSKESAVTFLLVMPLTLLYINNWSFSGLVIKTGLLCSLLLIACIAAVELYKSSSLGTVSPVNAVIYYENGLLGNSFLYTGDFLVKLANAFTVLILYLKNFFYPVALVFYYGYNQVPVGSWSQPLVWFSFVLHLGLVLFAIFKLKKYPEISYGIFFYFISISFYTHLAMPLADTMADRFFFTPSLPFIMVCVFSICRLLKVDISSAWSEDKKYTLRNYLISAKGLLCLVIVLLFSLRTYSRNKVWKDDLTLISSDMPALENCARAHYFYANQLRILLKKSYDAGAEQQMIYHFKKSIEISNDCYYSYLGLSAYLCEIKKYEEGIAVLKKCIAIYPDLADPHFYLGEALYNSNKYEEAIQQLQITNKLAPQALNPYYYLALSYSGNGNFQQAINVLKEIQYKFSESTYLYDALAKVYFEKGTVFHKKQLNAASSAIQEYDTSIPFSREENEDIRLSTIFALKSSEFGLDAKRIFKEIIGRYQAINDNYHASEYYQMALSKGVFQRQ